MFIDVKKNVNILGEAVALSNLCEDLPLGVISLDMHSYNILERLGQDDLQWFEVGNMPILPIIDGIAIR